MEKQFNIKDITHIIWDVLDEMNKAADKHPVWPTSPVERAAIVSEEAGEVIREANHIREGCGDPELLKKELIQTIGTCMRMLVIMERDEINHTGRCGLIYDFLSINKIDFTTRPINNGSQVNGHYFKFQTPEKTDYIIEIYSSDKNVFNKHKASNAPIIIELNFDAIMERLSLEFPYKEREENGN